MKLSIFKFIDINLNIRNERKNVEKLVGVYLKLLLSHFKLFKTINLSIELRLRHSILFQWSDMQSINKHIHEY